MQHRGTTQLPLVFYQVFPRNHTEKGTLQDVTRDIERIRKMLCAGAVLYLLPVHPPGVAARKGSLGSPYAIQDYLQIDPMLVGEGENGARGTPASDAGYDELRELIDTAHKHELRVCLDVVFAHTSPDSVLAKEHPEWFVHDLSGNPAPVVAEWTDVVTLDYEKGGVELAEYLVSCLQKLVDVGVDGFRCDVAGAVPLWFWRYAREKLSHDLVNSFFSFAFIMCFLYQRHRSFGLRKHLVLSGLKMHALWVLTIPLTAKCCWRRAVHLTWFMTMMHTQ